MICNNLGGRREQGDKVNEGSRFKYFRKIIFKISFCITHFLDVASRFFLGDVLG